jgi:hypothetical protein
LPPGIISSLLVFTGINALPVAARQEKISRGDVPGLCILCLGFPFSDNHPDEQFYVVLGTSALNHRQSNASRVGTSTS